MGEFTIGKDLVIGMKEGEDIHEGVGPVQEVCGMGGSLCPTAATIPFPRGKPRPETGREGSSLSQCTAPWLAACTR